jgi:hypothetical protein
VVFRTLSALEPQCTTPFAATFTTALLKKLREASSEPAEDRPSQFDPSFIAELFGLISKKLGLIPSKCNDF